MSHTQEPWVFQRPYSGFNSKSQFKIAGIADANEVVVATGYLANDEDGSRIVACVNACAGIPTSVLEAVKSLDDSAFHSEFAKQRDELLAALKELTSTIGISHEGSIQWDAHKNARAIIAKVEASKS